MTANTPPRSLLDNPRLSQWIALPPGSVRVFTGKVELGQGILTAVAQMAADELAVELDRVEVVSGRTGATPEEGYTAGSHSVEVSGMAVRLVCAELRESLIRVAMAERGAQGTWEVVDGAVRVDGAPTGIDYWTHAPALALDRPWPGTAPLMRPADHRYIGRPVPRADLPAKVAGGGFIHDMVLPGMRHARVLRGPARGTPLLQLDMDRLSRLAGVEVMREHGFTALLADRLHLAEHALAVAEASARWSASDLHADMDTWQWPATQPCESRGLFDPAPPPLGGERFVLTASRPYLCHGSIGPSCALAWFRDGHLEVWSHTQGVGPLRRAIARALALGEAQVTVHHVPGAGCYGHNGADDVAFDAALIALRRPDRPVRVQWSRRQDMAVAPFGAAMATLASAELTADGRPHGWALEIWSGPHGQRPGMAGRANLLGTAEIAATAPAAEMAPDLPDAAGGGAVRNAFAPYDLPTQTVTHHLLRHPALHSSALRGLGTQINVLAIESLMDVLAERAGADPLAYRLRLLADARARAVLDLLAARCGWAQRGAAGTGRGLGIAYSRYKNQAAYSAVAARVEVDAAVRLTEVWCVTDAGLVVNPDGTRNQLEGGIIQAASWTLKEAVRFDDTGILTTGWDSYPILRFSEVPRIEVTLTGPPDGPPLGVGEAVVGPTTAAIANALAHALGIRLTHLPFTRERIEQALLES